MKNKNITTLFICQALIAVAIVAAALIAAIHFESPWMMAWSILALCFRGEYESKGERSEAE